jgi:hypothetical protein
MLSHMHNRDRAMAQVLTHRPLTAETWVRALVSPRGICGGQSDVKTGFSLNSTVPPSQYHSIVAVHTHISPEG